MADEKLAEYQTQVIMCILHIMANMRRTGSSALPELELSYPQILVLYALLEMESSTIGGLAGHLKISQGVISRTVDRMVEKGLVDRRRDTEDRRVVRLALSCEGADFATKMIAYHVERFGDVFGKINTADRGQFLQVLRDIDQRLEEGPGDS